MSTEDVWFIENTYRVLGEVALRAELVQVAAFAVAWVEKIDRDIAGGDL